MIRLPGTTPRNRRREREFTFDVRLGAATGGGSPRRSRWWVRPVFFCVLVAGLYFGGGLVLHLAREHWLHRIDQLALKKIEVTRDGVLAEPEIRQLAGIETGRNALTVDLYQVRQRLQRHPRIEEARVEIEFPDTMRLTVRERVPVARILLPRLGSVEAFLLIDDLGFVFLPFNRGAAPPDVIDAEAALPTLTGVNATGIASGRAVTEAPILAALKLLTAFDRSPLVAQADVVSVDVASPAVLTVLTRSGATITVAADREFGEQLLKWYSVHQYGLKSGFTIASLDLSVTNNPPLRWIDPGLPKPETEPSQRVVRPKRKPTRRHV